MIQMMLQQAEAAAGDYSRLRSIAYGASPIAEDVLRRARAVFGCDFVQFYGMTESSGGGSYLSPAAHDAPGQLTSCRSEEHTSELQSLMRNSYAVICLKKKTTH